MTVYTLQTEGLSYIEDRVDAVKNGWTRQVTVDWRGAKIRVRIRRDVYTFQSHFLAEVWSKASLSWSRVQSVPPESVIDSESAAWKTDLKYFADPDTDPFLITQSVVDELIAYAQQVVS